MTEKSEDQVWICDVCLTKYPKKSSYHWANDIQSENRNLYQNNPHCNGNLTAYIPHSKYLTLQKNLEGAEYIIDVEHRRNNKLESELAVAVEALRRIAEPSSEDIVIPIRKIAKEALGKIGNK